MLYPLPSETTDWLRQVSIASSRSDQFKIEIEIAR